MFEVGQILLIEHLPERALPVYDSSPNVLVWRGRDGIELTESVNDAVHLSVHDHPGDESIRMLEEVLSWSSSSSLQREESWNEGIMKAIAKVEERDLKVHSLLFGPATSPRLGETSSSVRFGRGRMTFPAVLSTLEILKGIMVPEGCVLALPEPEFLGRIALRGHLAGMCSFVGMSSMCVVASESDIEDHRMNVADLRDLYAVDHVMNF